MKRIPVVLLVSTIFWLTGCANFATGSLAYLAPVKPPLGGLVTIYKSPLSTNFANGTPVCEKEGKASAYFVWDVLFTGASVAWGDADIDMAVKQGGLTTVEYVDYELLQFFGIFGKFTTVAHGS